MSRQTWSQGDAAEKLIEEAKSPQILKASRLGGEKDHENPGNHNGGATSVCIPNTKVMPSGAEGAARGAATSSRTSSRASPGVSVSLRCRTRTRGNKIT